MSCTDTLERPLTLDLPPVSYRPCYDIHKSYADNAACGPQFAGPIPKRVWTNSLQWGDFLGYKVASPIGIPAGPLLNAKWIAFAAAMGFDILTYKTMRSRPVASHPVPNVVMVQVTGSTATQIFVEPQEIGDLGITNSFGNPSRDAAYLQEDILRARNALGQGQVLIVSVFGTGETLQEVSEDYTRAALIAKEAGAHIIEANFSCPNLSATEGSLYCDSYAAGMIASQMAKAIAPMPLIIKLGTFSSPAALKATFLALAKANVQAVCGINTVPMPIHKPDGTPALPGRPVGGVCGGPIRQTALDFVSQARRTIDAEGLDFSLLGCGGIMRANHFNEFLAAGADIAMAATGMMWDPYLALRWQQANVF